MCITQSSFILVFFFFLSFPGLTVDEIVKEFQLFVDPGEGGAYGKQQYRLWQQILRLNSNAAAVWIWTVCLEYPYRSPMKCAKICEKHLKHRCLTDVPYNTSSSSDILSCPSPIHMLMLNQAAQSASVSNHFFFSSFFFQAINLPWREIKA